MSIFDVFSNGSLGSALDVLTSQAKSAARGIQRQTPGGMGGLLGAGALGALLGNVMNSDVMKNVALAGAGAVAWNFYKKWAQSRNEQPDQQAIATEQHSASSGWQALDRPPASSANIDPVSELVIRAMDYAARSDGKIDATERQRMDAIINGMLPGENVSTVAAEITQEPIDPGKIAASVRSPEQAEDVYRLTCSVIDVDTFMESSYTNALANALGISSSRKQEIEREAQEARMQLEKALPA